MSGDFEPSPRATKRRRTTRHSDQGVHLENEEKDAAGSDEITEQDRQSVASDTIEVIRSTKDQILSSTKSAAATRRADSCTDNIDAHLSSDPEAATPGSSKSQPRGVSSRGKTDYRGQKDAGPSVVGEDQIVESSETNTAQATRSSGRSRRPPKRLADVLDEPSPSKVPKRKIVTTQVEDPNSRTASPAPPKGILTPSRKQKSRPQKSVAFNYEDKEIEEQLGFRDIDTPAPKKLPKKSTPYPSRSLNLNRFRETEVATIVDDVRSEPIQSSIESLVADDFLDTIPVPEFASAPLLARSSNREDPGFLRVKHQVLNRLLSRSLPANHPDHLDSQFKQVHSLLKSTVASSESNSVLLLGPRGAGKTMLLDLALRDLAEEFSDDFHVVRLNGFLQTDDRLALREIWRQLGYSRNLEEAETEDIGASYADTMASLLSLLSHADEMILDDEDENELTSANAQRTTKSIVFILDEFDLFTTHPRQTLLYNLFDIAQSRKAPIVVVGCSSRMDVIECLEKRVKSRFSHRWILIPGCKSLVEWDNEVKKALTIRHTEVELSRLAEKELADIQNWNTLIESDFYSRNEVQHLIRREFYVSKSLPQLFINLYPSVITLQCDDTVSSAKKVAGNHEAARSPHMATSPSVLVTLNGLPALHISLLISMCRLEAIHTLTTVNFNLVYTHYTELIDTSRLKQTAHGSITHSGSLRKWNRELCREAWEELGIEGLIVPVAGGRDEDGNSGGAEMEETRMWRSEVGLDDILWCVKEKFDMHVQGGGGGAGEVLLKWCKEA